MTTRAWSMLVNHSAFSTSPLWSKRTKPHERRALAVSMTRTFGMSALVRSGRSEDDGAAFSIVGGGADAFIEGDLR